MPVSLNSLILSSFAYLFMECYYSVREIFMFGSRKSAKTKHVALRLILRAMRDKNYNALVMRKLARDLDESVKEELDWAIRILGVGHLWIYKISKREYQYIPYGNKIKLRGISINAEGKPSMSGLNVSKGWIQDCWLEEAWEFTPDDYNMIRQTLRGGTFTLLIVGNPYYATIWCVKKAIEFLEPTLHELKTKGQMWGYFEKGEGVLESIVHWNNFLINTKLSQADIEERWEEGRRNPKDFIVTGYGMPGSPTGTILGDIIDLIGHRDLDYFTQRPIEYGFGHDIGITRDAHTIMFGGISVTGEITTAEGYYHSNGRQEANRYSDNGVWRHKNPQELINDVIEYIDMWRPVWKRTNDKIEVSVDNADNGYVFFCNQELKNRGITDVKFRRTVGDDNKKEIEDRVLWERALISKGLMSVLTIDGVPQPTRLLYEFANIPWKISNKGIASIERDGSKVHPDMTNAFEYLVRRWMNKTAKKHDKIR